MATLTVNDVPIKVSVSESNALPVGHHPDGMVLRSNGNGNLEWIDPNETTTIEEHEFPSYGCKQFIQRKIVRYNPTMKFGPMTTCLSDLFARGFHLEIIYMPYQQKMVTKRRPSLYLVADGKRYCVCKVLWSRFTSARSNGNIDLAQFVTDGRDFMASQSPAPTYIINPSDPTDPWEMIMKKYPTPRVKMIGNRTVREHIEDSLGVLP